MNGNKLAALAFAASLVATAAPSFASTTVTQTVTVKWNTQALNSLTLTTQASASATHTAGAEKLYWNGNTSATSGCNGAIGVASNGGAETAGSAAGTVNFGNVTPDAVQYTDCMETNGIDATIATNDTLGYLVQVGISAAVPTGYNTAGGNELCLLPDGAWANNLAFTSSVRVAAPSIVSATACPGGDFQIGSTTPGTTILPSTGAGGTTAKTDLNADVELVLGPNAASGAQAPVVTYTLTAN